jgi:hypothetical protein
MQLNPLFKRTLKLVSTPKIILSNELKSNLHVNFSKIEHVSLQKYSPKNVFRSCVNSFEDHTVFAGERCIESSLAAIVASAFRSPGAGIVIVNAHPRVMDLVYTQKVKPDDIILIGTRRLDEREETFIKRTKIKTFSKALVNDIGIEAIMQETQWILDQNNRPSYHLSLDVDSVNEKELKFIGSYANHVWFDDFGSLDLTGTNKTQMKAIKYCLVN